MAKNEHEHRRKMSGNLPSAHIRSKNRHEHSCSAITLKQSNACTKQNLPSYRKKNSSSILDSPAIKKTLAMYYKNNGNVPDSILAAASAYTPKIVKEKRFIDLPKLPNSIAQKITEKLIMKGDKLKPSEELKKFVANQVDSYLQPIIEQGLLNDKDVEILKPQIIRVMYYQRNNDSKSKIRIVKQIMTKHFASAE